MTFWGVLTEGGQMLLGAPREAVLSFDRDAPADQLKAVFPADSLWEPLAEVLAYDGGQGVFRGVVDEQTARLTGEGLFIELVCRSREALLLDNEAEPSPIRNPSLEVLQKKLLEPLGFDKVTGSPQAARGELAIEKGRSCWQVLAGFCGDILGTEPYVDFDGTLRCEGVPSREVKLKNVVSAEISRMPCKRLSAVWMQSCRGGYDTLYADPDAPAVRRRYVSAQSGANPKELLEKSRRGSRMLTLTCEGRWWPLRGALASGALPQAGRFERCPVVKAVYHWDGNGERTKFVLEQEDGLCG